MDGYSSDGTEPVHLDNDATDFFPSINVSYNLTEKHLIRAAYGRSVNRPEFREVVPYVYFNLERDANIVGNVDLKNAYADNLDLRYEFYPATGEMITLAVSTNVSKTRSKRHTTKPVRACNIPIIMRRTPKLSVWNWISVKTSTLSG